LKNPRNAIRKGAYSVVSIITAGNKTQIQSVIDEDLVPTLMLMVLKESPDVSTEAILAIANITAGGTKEQIEYLVSKGVLNMFKDFLQKKNKAGIKPLLKALQNILSTDDLYVKSFEQIGGKKILSQEI